MYQVPEEITNKASNKAVVDANKVRGLAVVEDTAERSAIQADFRKIGGLCSVISDNKVYQYDGVDLSNANWEDSANWKEFGGGGSTWNIQEVDGDVAVAEYGALYRIIATAAPRTVLFPDPSVDNIGKQIAVELHIDTHKVTVGTVGSIVGAIDGSNTDLITRVSSIVIYQSNGTQWQRVIDTRNMRTRETVNGDRDFTTDGIEHAMIYEITANANILLPPPKTFNNENVVEATFLLKGAGIIATFSRSDGGNIGSLNTQTISTNDKGFTISEGNGVYGIPQDSRPSSSNLIGLDFFRLTELSAIAGYRKLVTSKEDPEYSSVTINETSPSISSETPSVLTGDSFVTLADDIPNLVDATTLTVTSTLRKTSTVQANVSVYYSFYKRTAAGAETLIVQSAPAIISLTTFEQRVVNVDFPQTSFDATDLLVMKRFVAKTAGSGTPTLTTKYEGTDPAKFSFKINASSLEHNRLIGRSVANAHPDSSIANTSTLTGATVKDVFDNMVSFFNTLFSGKSSNDLAHTTSGAVLTNVGDEIRANAALITVLQGSSDILVTQTNISVNDTPYDLIPDGYELVEASYTCVSGCDGLFIMELESLAGGTFLNAGASIDATSVDKIEYISTFSGATSGNTTGALVEYNQLGVRAINTSGEARAVKLSAYIGNTWDSAIFDLKLRLRKNL